MASVPRSEAPPGPLSGWWLVLSRSEGAQTKGIPVVGLHQIVVELGKKGWQVPGPSYVFSLASRNCTIRRIEPSRIMGAYKKRGPFKMFENTEKSFVHAHCFNSKLYFELTRLLVPVSCSLAAAVAQRFCGRDSDRVRGGYPVVDAGDLRADEARNRAERGSRSGRVDVTACSRPVGRPEESRSRALRGERGRHAAARVARGRRRAATDRRTRHRYADSLMLAGSRYGWFRPRILGYYLGSRGLSEIKVERDQMFWRPSLLLFSATGRPDKSLVTDRHPPR